MSIEQSINYSKLFAKLIGKNGRMDDTIASFLYYMFPKEMFVRALSLIESSDMFIYVFERQQLNSSTMEATKSTSTDADKSFGSEAKSPQHSVKDEATMTNSTQGLLVSSIYDNESDILYRLIVKPEHEKEPSIYVDLSNWFCSCAEYTESFMEHVENHDSMEHSLADRLIKDTKDVQEFSDDRFAQLDAHSLSKQRYFQHSKVICPHLLAFSMLLRSSKRVLRYFAVEKGQVLLISINNMDEWLKLHINIVA